MRNIGEQRVTKTTAAFLRKALPSWVDEGLLSRDSADLIYERYGLGKAVVSLDLGRLLILGVSVIGTLLIGGGVIAIVSANWEDMSVLLRCLIIATMMLVSQIGLVWSLGKSDKPYLKSVCAILQMLVFGSGIGLVAQIFDIDFQTGNALFVWTVLAFLLSILIRDTPTAALSMILSVFWYTFQQIYLRLTFGNTFSDTLDSLGGVALAEQVIRMGLPYLLLVLYFRLSVAFKSNMLCLLLVINAIILTFFISGFGSSCNYALRLFYVMGLALLLPLLQRRYFPERDGSAEHIQSLSSVLSWIFFGIYLIHYSYSFHYSSSGHSLFVWWGVIGVAFVFFSALFALTCRNEPVLRKSNGWVVCYAGAILSVLVGGYFIIEGAVSLTTAVVFNLAVVLFGIAHLTAGFIQRKRSLFWGGLLMILILVLCRFFEIESALIVKGICFIGLGLLTIWIGHRFEKWLKTNTVSADIVAAMPEDSTYEENHDDK
ncbi:MAG: DUF2157 domain-containing protein [Candidatus Sumerlaeales bacterium]|nr:DUF2157 domain-containing protein [Candidatus Sumerlaeales bacterium]